MYRYSVLIFFQYLNVQKLLEAVYECKVNSIYWYFQLKKYVILNDYADKTELIWEFVNESVTYIDNLKNNIVETFF